MATKYNGLFDYAANYNVQLAQPLDTRGVCDSVAALLAKDTFGTGGSFAYDGLTVVVPNAGVYYLKDKSKLTAKVNAAGYTDPTSATDEELLAAGWQKLGDQAASNVNSINGKTGNVTLAAGDIGITTIDGVEGENIQAALEAINIKASTAYKYKGSKATYEELPAEGNKVGDVWNVVAAHGTTPAGTNYAWTGTEWDALGGLVDLSTYQTKAITIDGAATTVEAAIAANKTSAANNATAINKNKTDIETVSGSVKGLDTLVKSKQDAAVDVSVNGTPYTTIPEAIGALDTYVGEVKAVSDGAAKVDASNITDTGAWKTKLGYALESSLNTVATNVETVSSDLKSLSTKVDTISSDLDTLEVSVATKASNTDLQTVSAQVDVNTAAISTKATQADMTALSGKVETNTSAIAAANTAIEGKADKATTLAGYSIGDAYTKTEVNTELGKKQDKLKFYSELGSDEDFSGEVRISVYNTDINSAHVNISGTETGIILSAPSATARIEINGAVSGAAISTSIPASETAVDTKLPSEKAVATAIESVKEVASKAYKYKGSDTYANIILKESPAVGDVWNSTTANGVYPKGTNYAWNGTEWDALGGEVDLSAYQKASDDTLATTSKTIVGAINEVKGVADAAAKADASNITVATWKEKLGFITASEVPEQVQPDWNATTGASSIANRPNISKSTTVSFETYELNNEGIYTLTSKTLNGLMSLGDITVVANSLSQPIKSITVPGGVYQAVLELTIDAGKTQRYNIDNIGSTNPTIIKEVVFGNDNTSYIADITSDESGRRVIAFASTDGNKAGSRFLRFELNLLKITQVI